MVIAMVLMAFIIGALYERVQNLQGGANLTNTTTSATTTAATTGQTGIKNDKAQSGKLADFLKSAVDPKFLKSCLDSGKYDSRLTADMAIARTLSVQGTPGFFVNSNPFPGAYSWSDMQPVVNSVLQGKAVPVASPQAGASSVTVAQIKDLWNKDLVKFGDADKKVLFVEVGDPSCPYCHAATGLDNTVSKQVGLTLVSDGGTYIAPVPEMRKLIDNGQASFVYVYYPGHGNGEMGMKAMYCANEQGKFWQVHDLIMSNSGYALMNGS